MPSTARTELTRRLNDFEEAMLARDAICPTTAGRPERRQGAAVIRAAVVLLSAAFEAYVEDVFDAAVDLIYTTADPADIKAFKKDTSGSLNNASVFKVNRLFFNLGIPWIMQHTNVRWQKFSNSKVQETLGDIITARNKIAHGANKSVRKPTALKWKGCIERLADRIDAIVADKVEIETGTRPW